MVERGRMFALLVHLDIGLERGFRSVVSLALLTSHRNHYRSSFPVKTVSRRRPAACQLKTAEIPHIPRWDRSRNPLLVVQKTASPETP